MNRVFNPLKEDHPLVTSDDVCPACRKRFYAGQRTSLIAVRSSWQPETVQAVPIHATCSLKGMETPVGVIDKIKDGDGSPFPVLTTDGKQWKFAEAGIEGIDVIIEELGNKNE